MGFSPGDFVGMDGVVRHVEQRRDFVRVYVDGTEIGPFFDLAPDQARKLVDQLRLAAHLIDGEDI